MNKVQRLLEQPDLLKRLYLDKRLPTREIGAQFGMSKHPVLDALHILGIETRSARTKGTVPTEQQLRCWILDDHRTLANVAEELGVHYAAVRIGSINTTSLGMARFGASVMRAANLKNRRPSNCSNGTGATK